jgi:hypothetical protein
MNNKFLIACCIASFIGGICGAMIVYDLAQHHECTVEFEHGKEVHVVIGSR